LWLKLYLGIHFVLTIGAETLARRYISLAYHQIPRRALIFHEYIYYQWKNKLLDDEIYRSWSSYLEHIVKRHNLDVISSGVQNIFPGDFGRYISQIRAKL
jgi:hypothetical protein